MRSTSAPSSMHLCASKNNAVRMDGDVCYGCDVDLADGVALQTSGGPYYDVPKKNTIMGGAVAFMLSGFRFDWRMTDSLTLYASYTQYDLVNPQARRSVEALGRYCDKCDWPIARIGVSYVF